MTTKRHLGLPIPAALLCGLLGWLAISPGVADAADPPVQQVPVTAAQAQIQDVPEY